MSGDPDGPTVIVVAPGEGAAGEDGDGGEVQAVVEAAAVEEVADAAVEIARIEAERDVTIAAIQAETVEVLAEANTEEELAACRTEITRLEALSIAQQTELERLTLELSRTSPPNPNGSTHPETGEGSTETITDEGEPAAVEVAEAVETPEPPKPKRRAHRWI